MIYSDKSLRIDAKVKLNEMCSWTCSSRAQLYDNLFDCFLLKHLIYLNQLNGGKEYLVLNKR